MGVGLGVGFTKGDHDVGLKKHGIAFTDEQWKGLETLRLERNISVNALVRELVDNALKLVSKGKTPQ